MTERKPTGVDFETWIDRQIRTARERGDLDDLPGEGKPLPDMDKPRDELWWARDYVQREGLSTEALLPTPLQLRREVERLPDTVRGLSTEQAVRDTAEELNLRIVHWLRAPSGPRVPIAPVDAESVVRQWRADQAAATETDDAAAAGPTDRARPSEAPLPRRRWWHRLRDRLKPGSSKTPSGR
ncbi:hypothetical protein FHX42_003385 [Saccharopolyspora lacisalsi]|uniref:DnaJ homologue subfamily C member 28 conserved domain-containing protein n=1 Tax=Halosaccharopolyspora lacisalsi TaxID=1000566 RepID=A0A839DZ83_9PSEU|nr:DUF1992 domain-containing protein [Halosaccharopolyspora lacisalsi]MBA8826019.1 hypothetical protein [Halosaccharopolyspora lacisalsi]